MSAWATRRVQYSSVAPPPTLSPCRGRSGQCALGQCLRRAARWRDRQCRARNFIGTNAAGTGPVPNVLGILVFVDCLDTTIGGPGSAGNIIAFNSDQAISVNPSSSGTAIFGNSIFANEKLGIDLSGGIEDGNGVTANDFPDSDVGANNLQNYPTINSIAVSGSDRTVDGELASNPNTDYASTFTVTPR